MLTVAPLFDMPACGAAMRRVVLLLFVVLALADCGLCKENILVSNQPLSISHTRLQNGIIQKLLQRGHQVTVLKWAISEQV